MVSCPKNPQAATFPERIVSDNEDARMLNLMVVQVGPPGEALGLECLRYLAISLICWLPAHPDPHHVTEKVPRDNLLVQHEPA